MTKIPIVDENDNVIGAKGRFEVGPTDIDRATGLWIINPKNEILLARRSRTKRYSPGCWAPAVAGTVEEGETYESNIKKEAEEELGITNIDFIKGPKLRLKSQHDYFAQMFIVKLDWELSDFKIDEKEIEEIRWITKEELLEEVKKSPENFVTGIVQIVTAGLIDELLG